MMSPVEASAACWSGITAESVRKNWAMDRPATCPHTHTTPREKHMPCAISAAPGPTYDHPHNVNPAERHTRTFFVRTCDHHLYAN